MFFTDVFWTLLVLKTAQGRKLSAAIFSVILVFLSAVTITSFVENYWYVIPAALGAFLGTYVTVRRDRR
jgi:hypothetical protein